jgi:hypothetical protein
MQKVVGSSPIIRFDESPGNRAFLFAGKTIFIAPCACGRTG